MNALGSHQVLLEVIVDPYYFVYEAEKLGYHSQIIYQEENKRWDGRVRSRCHN